MPTAATGSHPLRFKFQENEIFFSQQPSHLPLYLPKWSNLNPELACLTITEAGELTVLVDLSLGKMFHP